MGINNINNNDNPHGRLIISFKKSVELIFNQIFSDLIFRLVIIEISIKIHNLLGLLAQGQQADSIELTTRTYTILDCIFREILFLCLTKCQYREQLVCSRILLIFNINQLYISQSNGPILIGVQSVFECVHLLVTVLCTFLIAFEIKQSIFFSELKSEPDEQRKEYLKIQTAQKKIQSIQISQKNQPLLDNNVQDELGTTVSDEEGDAMLTISDVKEFRSGIPVVTSDDQNVGPENIPFDKNLELSHMQLTFKDSQDENYYYEGFYGIGYEGMLRCQRPKAKVSVIIKKNKNNLDQKTFKGFLIELKMMMFVGKHENLVELIGAWTKQISEGRLYIITEFCNNNTLENYLKQISSKLNLGEKGIIQDESVKRELFRWTYEVACGMQYLASKEVVHGSLSTKKIFLTAHKTVKLTEFAIAPYLPIFQNPEVNTDPSIEEINESWPWRNLPWESLAHRRFTVESDVWSYAITTWEILNLAKIPYAEFDTFKPSFLESLENGYQPVFLHVPADARKFLETCLSFHPENRPGFKQVLISMYDLTRPKRRKISFK